MCTLFLISLTYISKPYPRKGTETSIALLNIVKILQISKPYPRKGTETQQSPSSERMLNISKPYPRKGTETISSLLYIPAALIISKPYPRKGTETDYMIYGQFIKYEFQNHIPARGRKPTAFIF